MPDTVNRLASLTSFGLSDTSARVYLALVDEPCMTASALASAANVPRSHLYNVVRDLQALDLVEVLAEESRRSFRAKPITSFLARRARDLEAEVRSLRVAERDLAPLMQPPPMDRTLDIEAGEVRLVIGRAAVANEIDGILSAAHTSVTVSASSHGTIRMARHLGRWKEATQAKHIRPTVYLPELGVAAADAKPFPVESVDVRRLHARLPFISVIVDHTALLAVHPIPDSSDERIGRDFGIYTSDHTFARAHEVLLAEAARAPPHGPSDARGA